MRRLAMSAPDDGAWTAAAEWAEPDGGASWHDDAVWSN